MKLRCIVLIVSIGLSAALEARCPRRCRRSAVASFLGGITGATVAAASYDYACYYDEGPPYEFAYPGAPIFAYDYPTYLYAPEYAYPDVRYNIYPSYFFRR